jgi:selenocysteine lyase/cysteine desulfurase
MDPVMQHLRAREFSRLDASGHAYLDYTGGGLYAESQIRAHADRLCAGVFGNPHSHNPASLASTHHIEHTRQRILEFFDADPAEYEVVFTLNASGALKLVGESYPFGPGSRYLLSVDNHNSVNGIREFAAARGATIDYIPLDAELRIRQAELERHLAQADPAKPNLFAYPAQSNFSGTKHPLEWVRLARSMGYDVLLDAAAYVPTSPLSLRETAPDFVSLSFYKMFGYPTGIGTLIARREALSRLRRPWFGGGTVRFVSAQNRLHLLQPTGEAFEDGTLNYLSIMAVAAGLDFLSEVGMARIGAHVMALTGLLLDGLQSLRHSNGAPLVDIYGPRTTRMRGGTVAFNVLTPNGREVDSKLVERRANEADISVRSGCFCNPGAAESAFEYAAVEAYQCFNLITPEAFTLQQFSTCMNEKPVGAVRASVGIASNEEDVSRLIELLGTFVDYSPAPDAGRIMPEFVGQ